VNFYFQEKSMSKKKIVICSDSIQKITGLGKTALRIAKGFYDSGYDVVYFVLTGQDTDIKCKDIYDSVYADLFNHMPIYNCQLMDANKYKSFDDYILTEKPDIVYSLIDPWNLDQIELSSFRDTFYWVAHCLFETPEYPEHAMVTSYLKHDSPRKSIFDPLRKADLVIPVTKMGEGTLDLRDVKHTDHIYLGIDCHKACKESLTKQQVFGSNVSDDDFIFMTVGRNSERKKLDKILEAFAIFLSNKKEEGDERVYRLYMHTDFNEAVGGTDLISLASSLNIINNVMFPVHFIKNEIMLDKDLYKRYSVCDAYIELSAGEGFCYGTLEALLHNKSVVYLNYGGHAEYCNAFGYAVSVSEYYSARNVNVRWALPKMNDAVRGMNIISNTSYAPIKSSDFVKETFDWDSVIIPKLLKTIEDNFVQKRKMSFNLKKVM